MKNPDVKKLQAQCDAWNKANPVGTEVVVTKDLGEEVLTATRSDAQVLSGHTAVIWLNGITGCYLLDRVRVRKCRVCGCTTFHACHITREEHGRTLLLGACTWVENDLCSACVGKAVPVS